VFKDGANYAYFLQLIITQDVVVLKNKKNSLSKMNYNTRI